MSAASTPFHIDTPLLPAQCSHVQLNWEGGTPPYHITVGTYYQKILAEYPSLSNTSVTWVANVSAGSPVAVFGTDTAGAQANSDIFIMGPGSDSCLQDAAAHGNQALSPGAIAGIAVAGAVVLVVVCVLVLCLRRRRRRGDWRRQAMVDLNASTLAPAQPPLSTKALMSQRELPSMDTEAPFAGSSSSSLAGESVSGQVGEYTPRPAPQAELRAPPNKQSAGSPAGGPGAQAARGESGSGGRRSEGRVRAHALDGGVRLAGGPLDVSDDGSETTLPPPYRVY